MLLDFRMRWRQLRDAIAANRVTEVSRLWDDVGEQLQAGMAADDANTEANVFEGRIASGETVVPAMTVCVIDGAVYAADGANAARKASGVAVTGAGKGGSAMWTPGDSLVLCRVKRSTGVTGYGALYQSVTKGVLTNDPEETGLAYVQRVGQFVRWENPRDGSTPDLAWVWLDVSGGISGGDIDLALSDLTDVDADSPVDNDFLRYEADTGKWTAEQGRLARLYGDVNIDEGAVEDGEVLMYHDGEWINGTSSSVIIQAGAFTPTTIGASETFTVPADKQVLFVEPIDVVGGLIIDGAMVEVD